MKRRNYALFVVVAVIGLVLCLSGCDCPCDGDGDTPCPWDDRDDGDTLRPDDEDTPHPCPCDDDDTDDTDTDDGNIADDSGATSDETTTAMDQTTAENLMALLMMKGVDDIPGDALINDFIEDLPLEMIINNMPIEMIVDDFLDGIPSEMTIEEFMEQITIEDIINWFSTKKRTDTPTFLRNWALDRVKDALLSGTAVNQKTELMTGSVLKTGSCNSGTYQAEGAWTGPEETTLENICEVSDVEMIIGTDNCKINSITANGEIRISVEGNICSPGVMSVDLMNFNVHESYSDTLITFNAFNMTANVEFPETLLGDLHVISVMNGDMTVDGVTLELSGFTEDLTAGLNSGVTTSFNGSVKGSCVENWVAVETVLPITFDTNDDHHCPTSGEINFSGNGEATASFSIDGSMTVGEAAFSSCYDLPDACQ